MRTFEKIKTSHEWIKSQINKEKIDEYLGELMVMAYEAGYEAGYDDSNREQETNLSYRLGWCDACDCIEQEIEGGSPLLAKVREIKAEESEDNDDTD